MLTTWIPKNFLLFFVQAFINLNFIREKKYFFHGLLTYYYFQSLYFVRTTRCDFPGAETVVSQKGQDRKYTRRGRWRNQSGPEGWLCFTSTPEWILIKLWEISAINKWVNRLPTDDRTQADCHHTLSSRPDY